MWLLGPSHSEFWYRVPSIIAGIGTVILAGLIGRRKSAAAGVFAMLLTAFSYVLLLYSSEARGYACAIFFSYLSFYALTLYLERPRWPVAALYSASTVLGLASHLIVINVLLASMAWMYWELDSLEIFGKERMRSFLFCFAAPLLFLVVLYIVDIRKMAEGGGPIQLTLFDAFISALAWTFGTATPGWVELPLALAALALLARMKRDKLGAFLFYAGVIFLSPIVLGIVRNAGTTYVRYFVLSIAFLLLPASDQLAALYQRSASGKASCFFILAAYLSLNGWHIAELFRYGRGHYREAIRYMTENSHGPVITIDSDNDFQVPLMLDYYGSVTDGKRIEYRLKKTGPWGAEWLICQKESFEDPAPPHAQLAESAGFQYQLVKTFPTAPLSGLRWYLYQKQAAPAKL
jgi:hypothetical protein